MNILESKNLKKLNECELLKQAENVPQRKRQVGKKLIIKDIVENTLLILVSLIPMIIAPTYNKMRGIHEWKRSFVYNPDVLFLTLPFLIHCWLSFVDSRRAKLRMLISYGYTILLLIIISTFIFLKIASLEIGLTKGVTIPMVIWLLVLSSYVFCIMTSIAAL